MKRIATIVLMGALVVLPMRVGYSKSLNEWFITPGGSPPVITHWFASEELHHGDIWKIYVEANDPDGDSIFSASLVKAFGWPSGLSSA